MTTIETTTTPTEYRAYDMVTEWAGPVRSTVRQAERDARAHVTGCARQTHGQIGSLAATIVVTRDGNRMATLDGDPVWPPHGRTSGAAHWGR